MPRRVADEIMKTVKTLQLYRVLQYPGLCLGIRHPQYGSAPLVRWTRLSQWCCICRSTDLEDARYRVYTLSCIGGSLVLTLLHILVLYSTEAEIG